MSIAEITLKIKNASVQQLNEILEILNKKVEAKIRKPNSWVEYLNTYKSEHPELSHKQAIAVALPLYKLNPVVKIKKAPKVAECAVCDNIAHANRI